MSNIVLSGESLQSVIKEASDLISSSASVTLGPEGRPVIVSKPYGSPYVTKDGHSVVSALEPSCPKVSALVKVIRQSTTKANDISGDGTTTATVLATSLIKKSFKQVSSGRSRTKLRSGMEKAKEIVLQFIKDSSRAVSSNEEIAQVGSISANGDHVIGRAIAEAIDKVGKEGVITVEEGKGLDEIDVSVVKGMVCDRGYLSPFFVNKKDSVVFDSPHILILNKKLTSIQQIATLLEEVAGSGRPILIIAEDVEAEALTSLVINHIDLRVSLKIAAVKAPGFGEKRAEMLEDIRILVGAKYVISDEMGVKLEDLKVDDLGSAKTVTVTKTHTTIVDGSGDASDVDARAQTIREQISDTNSEYDKEKLQERLAKLVGGVAVLRVGGATEVEVKERKDRVDDALHATRAAVNEGIVPGGGVTLLYAIKALESYSDGDDDELAGVEIVKESLSFPLKQIVENAGGNSEVVIDKLLTDYKKDLLYDVRKMQYVDAYSEGIIDPAKVVRIAIEAAISVASVLITAEAFVVDNPEDNNSSSGGGRSGGMPGGGMGMPGGMGMDGY